MSSFSLNAAIQKFLFGVTRALFILYLFGSPLLIEDEFRRMNESFNLAKVFLSLLAFIKLFFGFMHIFLKSNSKEITKLLLSMIILSEMVLHSNWSSTETFADIYLSQNGVQQSVFSSFIPSILDSDNLGIEMSKNVQETAINSLNLISYHWLIIIGVVSSICVQMISYADYSKIGRFGLGIFYIFYGLFIMLLSEFQRPWLHILSVNNFVNSSMSDTQIIRVLGCIAFGCMASGLSLLSSTKFVKIGIVMLIGYIFVLIMYETECLLIGQNVRNKNEIKPMLKSAEEQFIYPTDYQLLRIINLSMILSGTLFEMLKVFSPEKAMLTQAGYSNVDDEEEEINQNMRTEKKKRK